MTEYFMSKIPVKKIILVRQERFGCPGYKDPVEVRPISLITMQTMGDLSNYTLYLYPTPPTDVQTGIFRVFLTEK